MTTGFGKNWRFNDIPVLLTRGYNIWKIYYWSNKISEWKSLDSVLRDGSGYCVARTRNQHLLWLLTKMVLLSTHKICFGWGIGNLISVTHYWPLKRQSRQQQTTNFATSFLIFERNKIWYFMRIVCQQTILMKDHALLFLKKRQNLKLSFAANYRWRFKG